MCAVLPCPSLDRSQPLFYFVPQEKDSHSQAGSTSPSLPLMLESKKKTTNITQMPKYGGLQQCTIGFGTFFFREFWESPIYCKMPWAKSKYWNFLCYISRGSDVASQNVFAAESVLGCKVYLSSRRFSSDNVFVLFACCSSIKMYLYKR